MCSRKNRWSILFTTMWHHSTSHRIGRCELVYSSSPELTSLQHIYQIQVTISSWSNFNWPTFRTGWCRCRVSGVGCRCWCRRRCPTVKKLSKKSRKMSKNCNSSRITDPRSILKVEVFFWVAKCVRRFLGKNINTKPPEFSLLKVGWWNGCFKLAMKPDCYFSCRTWYEIEEC